MLTWAEAALCGAGGGLIVEAVVTFGRLNAWQQARHEARAAAKPLPPIGTFIDPPADSLAALFRVVLGGVAGWLLHGELAGVFAAVSVGASAPAVLAQVGRSTTAAEALRAGPAADPPPVDPAGGAAESPTPPGPPGFDPAQGEAAP